MGRLIALALTLLLVSPTLAHGPQAHGESPGPGGSGHLTIIEEDDDA
jgi:hypothetical protein